MLKKIDILIPYQDLSETLSEFPVKVHGFLMKNISPQYADELHKQDLRPYSICTLSNGKSISIHISTLTETASELIETMKKTSKIDIKGVKNKFSVEKYREYKPVSFSEIAGNNQNNKFKLSFITPASYKSSGKNCFMPDIPAYFYSVVCKINKFESLNIDFEKFKKLYSEVNIIGYAFQSINYNLTGNIIPSMIGEIHLEIPKNKEKFDILYKVFTYAMYSGVGGKTALGMGGFAIENL